MMRLFKKLLLGLAVAAWAALMATAPAAAITPLSNACDGAGSGSSVCAQASSTDDPIAGSNGVLPKVVSIMATVAGVVSIITLIWGGISYINSTGNSAEASKARNTIIYALVGLVIALLARPIINFAIELAIN